MLIRFVLCSVLCIALALRSDPRTNVGEKIRELIVAKRDQTERKKLFSILGLARILYSVAMVSDTGCVEAKNKLWKRVAPRSYDVSASLR